MEMSSTAMGRIYEIARQAEARLKGKQPEAPRQWFLPGLEEFRRAIPNHIARSCLFAPIRRGKRVLHNKTTLASRSDVCIVYSGQQLDEADRDVFLQLLFEARGFPLGQRVYIERAKFLQSMGRQTGNNDYKWLHGAFGRLFTGSLFIESKRYRVGNDSKRVQDWMHLVDRVRLDEAKNSYYFEIDPRISTLFSNQEYALIDWERRLKLGNMAKWLQCLVAASADPVQKYRVSDLKEWMAYTGRMYDFREKSLPAALDELKQLEIIAAPRIENGSKGLLLAMWTKVPGHRDKIARPSGQVRTQPGQYRHLSGQDRAPWL